MNTETHQFSEQCEIALWGLLQSKYDAYRLEHDLPQQPVKFATQEEKDAIRDHR